MQRLFYVAIEQPEQTTIHRSPTKTGLAVRQSLCLMKYRWSRRMTCLRCFPEQLLEDISCYWSCCRYWAVMEDALCDWCSIWGLPWGLSSNPSPDGWHADPTSSLQSAEYQVKHPTSLTGKLINAQPRPTVAIQYLCQLLANTTLLNLLH